MRNPQFYVSGKTTMLSSLALSSQVFIVYDSIADSETVSGSDTTEALRKEIASLRSGRLDILWNTQIESPDK